MIYNLLSIYFFVLVILNIYWASHARAMHGSSYMKSIVMLSIAVCFYMYGYSMELNARTISQLVFWNKFEYVGIPFVSALWLTVALIYTGHFYPIKKWLLVALYLIPFCTFILRFSNESHFLYFAEVRFMQEDGRLLMIKQPGIWMYVQLVHSLSMILITLLLYIRDFLKNKDHTTGKIYLMLVASFCAIAGLFGNILRPFPFQIDYTVLLLPITCFMVILSSVKYDFLETKAMARVKAFESSRDAILLISRQNRIIDFNDSAKFFFAKLKVTMMEGKVEKILAGHQELIERINSMEISMIRNPIESDEKYYEIRTERILNKNGFTTGRIKIIRDVTENYKLNETLKKQAMSDYLSGLANRRFFIQKGRDIILNRGDQRDNIYLIMMDLDHFKEVNDQYGHQMGDEVIQKFASILKNKFQENTLIARLGGEEFAMLLWDYTDEEIEVSAKQLLFDIANNEYQYKEKIFHVTSSMGIAKITNSEQSLDNLIRIADKALYKSKAQGRNCITGLDEIRAGIK